MEKKLKINELNNIDRPAGLLYVNDCEKGFTRKRGVNGFNYYDLDGKRIKDKKLLERIRSLVIPPAWENVWICPDARGHIQVTARDARGRKQYKYHTQWRLHRDENKYNRLKEFGETLPLIRKKLDEELAAKELPKNKVVALVIRILEQTYIRIGNENYAKENGSYGLTTLRDQHVTINGSELKFTFRGKSGVKHSIGLRDRMLAKLVKKCRDIPGYELFQYVDEHNAHQSVSSTDVNDFLRKITGKDFTAKDFRTWFGSVLASSMLSEIIPDERISYRKRQVNAVVNAVASKLGNTPSICRKCYVHPVVFEAFDSGRLAGLKKKKTGKYRNGEETILLQLLSGPVKKAA